MPMEKETFILETENGTITCEIIDTLYVTAYQKNYLVYTDNSKDQNGELNIFISSFNPEDKNYELKDITDENELKDISNIIEEMWNE